LLRINDPWGSLIASTRGYMLDEQAILQAAEED